jgi:hypothetical protein
MTNHKMINLSFGVLAVTLVSMSRPAVLTAACTPYYGKCRTKFPDNVRVLNIDLVKRLIQHLTGVAIGSNA